MQSRLESDKTTGWNTFDHKSSSLKGKDTSNYATMRKDKPNVLNQICLTAIHPQ